MVAPSFFISKERERSQFPVWENNRMLKFKRKISYKKSSQETKHSLQMKIFFLSKGFTLICQLSGVLNRSLNVLKQGRVEITHNWIMNKRTINCIGYHLLQLTAYITFLPLYLYIALFQTHFFPLLAAGFFTQHHVSKDKFWDRFEIFKKTNIPGHQSIRNIQIVRNNLLKGKIITTKQILHMTETFTKFKL